MAAGRSRRNVAVSIRPARAADAETIHAAIMGIADALGDPAKVTGTAEDLRRFGFGARPAFAALIAEADGAFAGLCLSFPSFSTWYGRPGAYVQDLYVAPGFRGCGIGAALLARLAADTRAAGGVYLRLSVDAANHGAQEFYARLGLVRSEQEQIFAARGDAFQRLADAAQGDTP